jgi:hypothetical protein
VIVLQRFLLLVGIFILTVAFFRFVAWYVGV